jgi:hypothetical protein
MSYDKAPELASIFFAKPLHIEDADPADPLVKRARHIGKLFTETVIFLAKHFQSKAINERARLFFDLVGSRTIPLALGPDVKTLSFVALGIRDTTQIETAAIISPQEWEVMFVDDPVMQTGAVVNMASRAVDVLNKRAICEHDARAQAYEAEYLMVLQKHAPKLEFNSYQRQLLKRFPDGLASPEALPFVYTSIPFVRPAE